MVLGVPGIEEYGENAVAEVIEFERDRDLLRDRTVLIR
jgi:hypothetical protein